LDASQTSPTPHLLPGHYVHATMKKNKGKAFVVIIPKTTKPMEIQAFYNLTQLG
jgi:hypothetical protein